MVDFDYKTIRGVLVEYSTYNYTEAKPTTRVHICTSILIAHRPRIRVVLGFRRGR